MKKIIIAMLIGSTFIFNGCSKNDIIENKVEIQKSAKTFAIKNAKIVAILKETKNKTGYFISFYDKEKENVITLEVPDDIWRMYHIGNTVDIKFNKNAILLDIELSK